MIGYILLFAFIGLLIVGFLEGHNDMKNHAVMVNDGQAPVTYLGGSPIIVETSAGYIKVNENALSFTRQNGEKPINTHWSNIKSAELKTHEQITSDVTAGRVLLLGVFALAAKKQTVHQKQYLIVHCTEEGIDYDMVFSADDGIGALVSKISGALINYRKKTSHKTVMAGN